MLKDRAPITKGGLRLVYEHPDDPAVLVKVMRPEAVAGRYGEKGTWWRRNRRHGPYILFVREIREYLAVRAQGGGYESSVQKIFGLVDTDMGLGLVVEAGRGPDGALAPTAARLIANGGFDARAAAALEDFNRAILESNVVLADLHERNIVYARMRDGSDRFVMIDGLGSSTILPFKSWFVGINRRSKEKRIARLNRRIAGRVAAYEAGTPMP
ncbi:YrbL family protein [Luteolibacter sp. SL250]|uniref:YrbL family protein n=1 Tax=Luteolibacter sp. SL250 TaxID=2995170 RepID=UPI002270EF3C|nr:YrbL family protein [Luteolibacter sp. SL250]WAC20183.1 YrbL family protein [Luteolibacter sp. SL250]